MPEKTKDELSDEINQILGTAIDFTKLSKDDLTKLYDSLAKLKEANEFSLPLLNRPIGDILDKKIGTRTLRELSLGEILGLPKDRKGILGFGILSRILERERSIEQKPKT